MEIPSHLVYLASWLSAIGGIWALFGKAEDVVSTSVKSDISKWLREASIKQILTGWPGTFTSVFDRVFSERHISIKCFLKSAIASLLGVFIMTTAWAAIKPDQFSYLIHSLRDDFDCVFILSAMIISNIILDYISLLETRWILNRLESNSSILRILIYLLLDFLITALVFLTPFVLSLGWVNTTDQLIEMLGRGLRLTASSRDTISVGIFFYTTYFTSVWIWLYIFSSITTRLLGVTGFGLKRIIGTLNIEEKPLRSLGFILVILISFIYVVIPIF